MTRDVLVAGGGVAGIACALALADAGLRVALCEQARRVGGRAVSWTDAATGDAVDIGPHVISSEHRNFVALLERLGTAQRVRWQPDPLLTLVEGGRVLHLRARRWPTPLHGLPNLPQALRSVSWADGWSNRRVAWIASRTDEAATLALDRSDALDWLRARGVSPRFIEWFWTPMCLALLGVPPERCSAAAALRVFRLMLGRSGWHFGFATCGLSQLWAEPAVDALLRAGARVQRGAAVRRVRVVDGRFDAFELADGRVVRARCAVLALPPAALAALDVPGLGVAADRFEPVPYVSTTLWFDRRLTRECFWARVWKPGDLNLDFYDLANIRGLPGDAGSVIAANAIDAREAQALSDAAVIERTRREIAELAPAVHAARLRHAVVHRIAMAVPAPRPGSERLRPPNATPIAGLWLAGDWTATHEPASMESAARSARLAAEGIAAVFDRCLAARAAPAPETTGAIALLQRGRRRRAAGRAAHGATDSAAASPAANTHRADRADPGPARGAAAAGRRSSSSPGDRTT
jgi:15-cis-phytoene desaturase